MIRIVEISYYCVRLKDTLHTVQPKTPSKARRNAIKNGLICAIPITLGISSFPLNAQQNVITTTDDNKELINLISTLRAMKNVVCDTAADNIEVSLNSDSAAFLHLRSAGLTLSDFLHLADALNNITNNNNSLQSFSASYNPNLGDSGAIALANSLPVTLLEIGFVGCNIRDEGGRALLQWANQSPNLNMICIEHNKLTKETKALFHKFSQENPEITVIL